MRINELVKAETIDNSDVLAFDSALGTKGILFENLVKSVDSKTEIKDSISDAFDETIAYQVGQYCIYMNRLFKFTEAKEIGPWDGTKVIPCTIGGELKGLYGEYGTHKMQLITGGDSIKGGDILTWFKFGKMVFISCAVWDFEIVNPADAEVNLSLPFKNTTVRVVGTMGYNSSGINIVPVSSEGNRHFSFNVKNPNGSTTSVRGNQLPKCTIQFNIIYKTD